MNPEIRITSSILKVIAEIDEFKGRWTATYAITPDRLAALKQVATIESIGSSTRIEGVKLNNQQIEALLRGVKAYSFRSRDEQEVAGYAEVMEMIFHSFGDISLTENHIKQLHSALLKYSSKDERHRGEYKKFPNHVEAFDPEGKRLGVIFETTSPFYTPSKMAELLEWTNEEIRKKEIHSLLIIAIFVVTFLRIHPFQDGNGRLSRVLTTLMLLRQGYSYVPYSSMERIIEDQKDSYYISLRSAQETLETDNSKLDQWIVFFLHCLREQKNILEKKINDELALLKLPNLSIQIIELIKSRGPSSVAEIVAVMKANRNTVKFHLKSLVQKEYLKQEGSGRGTRYYLGVK